MDLRLLRTFVAVAEEGSVSLAAHRLHYSQPRVSQQVQLFECAVGRRLFDRGGRGMALTESGQTVLPIARVVLHAMSLLSTPTPADAPSGDTGRSPVPGGPGLAQAPLRSVAHQS